jgi:hypothetical protein
VLYAVAVANCKCNGSVCNLLHQRRLLEKKSRNFDGQVNVNRHRYHRRSRRRRILEIAVSCENSTIKVGRQLRLGTIIPGVPTCDILTCQCKGKSYPSHWQPGSVNDVNALGERLLM